MEINLKITLIIISAVVICWIFLDGLWKIRKQKNPYALTTDNKDTEPQSRNFDGSGFDQDGVGQIKVSASIINTVHEENEKLAVEVSKDYADLQIPDRNTYVEKIEPNELVSDMPMSDANDINEGDDVDVDMDSLNHFSDIVVGHPIENDIESNKLDSPFDFIHSGNTSANANSQELNNKLNSETNNVFDDELLDSIRSSKPIYQEPVIRPKLSTNAPAPINNNVESINKAKRNKGQAEINFGNMNDIDDQTKSMSISREIINDEPSVENMSSVKEPKSSTKPLRAEVAPEVLAISVVMPNNQMMSGASLLPNLLTLGLKHGEMNIFHRHQDNAGNGEITFSLANMMNPGTFDLDHIETFSTRGITLFMMLPNAGNSFSVFEQMLSAAKLLCKEFDAQLLDDKRNVITKQTEQHYMSRIREFEIKNRAATA